MTTPYETLKHICTDACHERHACAQGYKDMLAADTIPSLVAVWRRYIVEFAGTMFADIVNGQVAPLYDTMREDMNAAGLYFNECPQDATSLSVIVICDSDTPIDIYGEATAYILGKAHVIAHDHTKVYCQQSDGSAELLDCSSGQFAAGSVVARGRSSLCCSVDCECYDASSVTISGGTLTDHGHLQITATHDATVLSFTRRKIILSDNAQLKIQ